MTPVLWFTVAAIVLGGLAGAVAESIFVAQLKRADVEWNGLLQQLYWSLQPLSIIVAAACLPRPLQRLFRAYTA